MTKNIAILVPSYNSIATLKATLEAILALSEELARHVDFLMLSDDGSKDNTVELAEATWNHPTVPMVVKRAEQNQGEYKNVNGAFAAMPEHIEWVAIMHSDNEVLPGWMDIFAREAKRVPKEVASICASYHYVSNGVVTCFGDKRGAEFVEDIAGEAASVRSTIARGCWWHNGCSINRVAAWKQVGGHPEDVPIESIMEILGLSKMRPYSKKNMRIKGDWDTSLRMLSNGMTIRYVGTPLMRYIEFSGSVSTGAFAWHGDLIETMQVMRRHQSVLTFKDICKNHSKIGITFLRRIIGSTLRRDFRRAWFGVLGIWYVPASFLATSGRKLLRWRVR